MFEPCNRRLASRQGEFIAMGRMSMPLAAKAAMAFVSAPLGLKSVGSTGPGGGALASAEGFSEPATAVAGHSAPSSIHFLIRSIFSFDSGSPSLGMKSSSLFGRLIRRTISLLAESPATNAGPVLPPLSAASRESRRIFPFCFSGPWHLMHSWRIGRISLWKSTVAAAPALRMPAAARAAPNRMGLFMVVSVCERKVKQARRAEAFGDSHFRGLPGQV